MLARTCTRPFVRRAFLKELRQDGLRRPRSALHLARVTVNRLRCCLRDLAGETDAVCRGYSAALEDELTGLLRTWPELARPREIERLDAKYEAFKRVVVGAPKPHAKRVATEKTH